MSLIQFRGRPILPPLISHESVEENDPQIKEDDIILSLPSSEALQAILCGLPDNSVYSSRLRDKLNSDINKPVPKAETKLTNFKECNSSIHNGLSKENGTNKVTFIRYKPSSNNLKYKNNFQVMQSSKSYVSKRGDHEPLLGLKDSPYSSNQNKERIHGENEIYSSPLSTPSSKVISSISNHQKLKVLRTSGTDSSSYLQDYLQLLTTRSEFTRVIKPKREAELRNDVFMERRGSAPSLASKKCVLNDRHRTSSGSSDKSGSSRSLGSTYLDSYLGNLTDHSWIIYPTTEVSSNTLLPKETENSSSPESKEGDYLQRKLRFIDPEKFFTVENKVVNGESKIETLEEPSQTTSIMKSCSSAENDNELGLTDTSGIVLSPDISSSSLDTDKLDASNPLSLASLQEIDEIKESPKSQELSSEIKDHTQESSYNSDTSPEDKSLSSKNGENGSVSKSSSSKLNVTFDTEPSENISPRSSNLASEDKSTQEDEEDIKDESTIADDSTDISSDDDAEDQVSMIICDIQKSSENLHNESKESLCDDSLVTKPNSSSLVSQASSDLSILENVNIPVDSLPLSQENPENMHKVDRFESEEIMSKLIKILQAKQEEELRELKIKHEREMEAFVNELSKLTSVQKSALANAYESPNNNNSLNEMLKSMNSVSQNLSQSSDSPDVDSDHNDHYTSLPSFNHTNLMPSFFLHDENQENNSIRRPDVNKISQIFSPSKGTIQNVAKFLNLSPNLLALKSDSESHAQLPATKESEQMEPAKQLFSQKQLEVGLDLVPTRESDGVCTSSSSSTLDSMQEGINKLQAIVRGKRIRKLMRTAQVQQLLATLKEVAKLAHQFHQDILMDNIRKGDIGFHKALYNEEQQAREKLIDIMVDSSPADQIRLIQRDRLLGEREKQRRVTTEQPRSNANHIPRLKLYSTSSSSLLESNVKSQSSPRSLLMSPHKRNSKQLPLPKKILISELPRPCKTAIASDSKSTAKHPCISPREKQSLIPSQKLWVSKGIPKHRITKKIDTLPLTHIPPRRQNAPICKSDSGYLSSSGVKPTKIGTSLPVREDDVASRKPWR